MVRHYTREAGVRNLERDIGTICRKQARRIAEGKTEKLVVTQEMMQEFLGGIKVRMDTEMAERTKRAGVAVGLAWTPAGGDILFIEAKQHEGQRRLHHDRADRPGDAGVDAGRAYLGALEREARWASNEDLFKETTSTSTCRRERSRKMVLRQASPWRRRWFRC